MKYSFSTPHTIYWEISRFHPLSPLVSYIPYIKIMGQFWEIERVNISIAEYTCSLFIDGVRYLESTSFSETMIKATEILRDLSFRDSGGVFDFTLCPIPSISQIDHPIIGWKKALNACWGQPQLIVKLRVPKGTFCNLTTYKCRAQKAEILGVYDLNLNPLDPETPIYSIYRSKNGFNVKGLEPHSKYQVGDTLVVEDFCYGNAICSTGIHFFRSPLLAIEYNY